MAGNVTRKAQAIPVVVGTSQGVGTVGSSGTPLDTTEQPYVIVLDESNPGRVVQPAGADVPQPVFASASLPVLAATAPVASTTITSTVTTITATALGGYTSALVTVHGTAWSALQLAFEGSDDAGVTWYPMWVTGGANGIFTTGDAPAGGVASSYVCGLRGFTQFRVRNALGASMTGSAVVSIWPLYGASDVMPNVRLWDGTDISQVTAAGGLNVSPLGKARVFPLTPFTRNNANTTAVIPAGTSTNVGTVPVIQFASLVDQVMVQNNGTSPITINWGIAPIPAINTGLGLLGDLQLAGGQNAFVSLDYQILWINIYNAGTASIPVNQASLSGIFVAGGTRP